MKEKLELVEVSPRPFTGQIIVIDWTQIDSAGVVVGSSQRVLNHPVKEAADLTAQEQFQRVSV